MNYDTVLKSALWKMYSILLLGGRTLSPQWCSVESLLGTVIGCNKVIKVDPREKKSSLYLAECFYFKVQLLTSRRLPVAETERKLISLCDIIY